MKMQFKKETKHTCVYETDAVEAAVASVYVSKVWLSDKRKAGVWPEEIELTVSVPA